MVDYEALANSALLYRPKLIVAGASAYARNWDYKKMREIADSVGAYLMADMAHVSGISLVLVKKLLEHFQLTYMFRNGLGWSGS